MYNMRTINMESLYSSIAIIKHSMENISEYCGYSLKVLKLYTTS